MMKTPIDAVSVCDGYDDLLALTMPHNRRLFHHFVVVCRPGDEAVKRICYTHDATVLETDAFDRDGPYRSGDGPGDGQPNWNKWAALNEAIRSIKGAEWVCVMDADIIVPHTFNIESSDPDALYGAYRVECPDRDALRRWEAGDRPVMQRIRSNPGYGYLQLFNVNGNPVRARMGEYFIEQYGYAGAGDTAFRAMFEGNIDDLGFEVIHLSHGRHGLNWWGRRSPRWDGKPVDAPTRFRVRAKKKLFVNNRIIPPGETFLVDWPGQNVEVIEPVYEGDPAARRHWQMSMDERFRDSVAGKRVACIAPGPTLAGSDQASFIESFDLVVRFNAALPISDPIARDTGTRCDVLCHCDQTDGYKGGELSPDTLAEYGVIWLMNGHNLLRSNTARWMSDSMAMLNLARRCGLSFHAPPPDLYDRIVSTCGHPNVGTVAIADLLYHGAAEVYCTGFTLSAGYCAGYKDDADPDRLKRSHRHHDFERQRRFLASEYGDDPRLTGDETFIRILGREGALCG